MFIHLELADLHIPLKQLAERPQLRPIRNHPQCRNERHRDFGEEKVFEPAKRVDEQDVVEEEVVKVERPE